MTTCVDRHAEVASYALAEIGRDTRVAGVALDDDADGDFRLQFAPGVTLEAAWRASAVSCPSTHKIPCWPCYLAAWSAHPLDMRAACTLADECPHDYVTEPWPPVPPNAVVDVTPSGKLPQPPEGRAA